MDGKVVIVTGASGALGKVVAEVALVRGARVACVDHSPAQSEATGNRIDIGGVDLTDATQAGKAIDVAASHFGRIDALINIAGAVPQIDLLEMTDAQWDDGMALKLHGARRITIHAWNALKESRGSVVFMSGNSAEAPKSAYAAVATINAAIVAMARAFAERGIKDGVQVNSVLPGPVLTNRRKTYMEKYAPAHDMSFEEAMEKFPAQTGISRYGQPEEIADLMAFLVSPQAKWMTGSAVRMDGGEIKGV